MLNEFYKTVKQINVLDMLDHVTLIDDIYRGNTRISLEVHFRNNVKIGLTIHRYIFVSNVLVKLHN